MAHAATKTPQVPLPFSAGQCAVEFFSRGGFHGPTLGRRAKFSTEMSQTHMGNGSGPRKLRDVPKEH